MQFHLRNEKNELCKENIFSNKMKQIFPKEILDSTVEVHQFNHSTSSKVIYTIILLSLVIIIGSLPFIKVDIYTSARGIIKPDKERLAINSMNSGHVIEANLKNNVLVQKGDTLVVMDNESLTERLQLSSQQIDNIDLFINDLTYLINIKHPKTKRVESPKYKKELLLFQQKQNELQTRFKRVKQNHNRNKILYDKGVIAKIEYENSEFEHNLALSNLYQLNRQQLNTWQGWLTEYSDKLLEIESSEKQLEESKSHFVVIAPIAGILLNVKSIEIGSYLAAGEQIAIISPETDLLVECYINPSEIGLIKTNTHANFQIDAYNYNQWGLASGKIVDISKDIEFIENTSVFKVQCSINESELMLKNGFQGKLKKGMTLNAQFKIAERTLFDLLYDKIDDWVNPSQNDVASIS